MTVKCAECGFLAIRSNTDGRLCEASNFYREDGWPKETHLVDGHGGMPVCFVRAFDLRKECVENANSLSNVVAINKAVISKERSCSRFCEWWQGFSPKEHLEMDLQRLETQRQEERHRESMHFVILAAIIGAIASLVGGAIGLLGGLLIGR